MTHVMSWTQFRATGLLWFVNRILHVFGWAIAVKIDQATGVIVDAYPQRTKYRGFPLEAEDEGFRAVSVYMAENALTLSDEADIDAHPDEEKVDP